MSVSESIFIYSKIANPLTKGAITRIFDGILEIEPILQILSVGKFRDGPEESTRILISDGDCSSCFAALAIGTSIVVLSKDVTQNSIIKIKRYAFSNIRKFLLIQELRIVQSDVSIGQCIGNPKPLKINNKISKSIKSSNPGYQPPISLTSGAIVNIYEGVTRKGPIKEVLQVYDGGDTEGPVLQVLNTKSWLEKEQKRFKLVLSDGQWSCSFSMLNIHLNDKVESGEITQNCIIKMNKYQVNTFHFNINYLFIEDLAVLKSGADIGQVIGDPQPMANELTRGILAVVFRNVDPGISPILQVLSICPHGPTMYSLVVSDGKWSSNLAILDPGLNDKVISGEICAKCIILLTDYCIQVDDNLQVKVMEIQDIRVLQSAADVLDQLIGDPVDLRCSKMPSELLNTFEKRGVYIKEAIHGIDNNIWHNY